MIGFSMANMISGLSRDVILEVETSRVERIVKLIRNLNQFTRLLVSHYGDQLELVGELLRAVAMLIPGGNTEIHAEGAQSIIQLIALYRDAPNVIKYHRNKKNVSLKNAKNIQFCLVLLSILKRVQLVTEMIMIRKSIGSRKQNIIRWNVVLFIECVKSVLRLSLFWIKNGRLISKQEEDLEQLSIENEEDSSADIQMHLDDDQSRLRVGKRSGRNFVLLDSTNMESREELVNRILDKRKVQKPSTEVNEGSDRVVVMTDVISEVLFIFRPVIHLLLVKKFGWKSWIPWITAMCVEILSIQLMPKSCKSSEETSAESERMRRKIQLLFYLVRHPFYGTVVRNAIYPRLIRIPIFTSMIQSAMDAVDNIQNHWFYTSAS